MTCGEKDDLEAEVFWRGDAVLGGAIKTGGRLACLALCAALHSNLATSDARCKLAICTATGGVDDEDGST